MMFLCEPEFIYHVAPSSADVSDGLLSLYAQRGDKASSIFLEKWPHSGDIGRVHSLFVHCWYLWTDAREHQKLYGGQIYSIDCAGLKIERDWIEFDHPMVWLRVGPEHILKEY